jgi:murein DD-endopeptidase MepM/ murein hydrolase activator NlpD
MKRRFLVGAALAALLVVFLAMHPVARALVRHSAEPAELVVPVAGLEPKRVSSSFGEPRSGHRRHQGADLFAPRGTEVLAAAPGRVVRVGEDRLGGHVVWVAGGGARLYYYAHLDRFAPGLASGDDVRAGDLVGFVGTTGNARGTSPHLHFGVYPAARGFRAVDPAPLLRAHGRRIASHRPAR